MRIQSRNVWQGGQFLPAQLLVEGSSIRQVLPCGGDLPDHDYGDARIVPGFIDQHTHGAYGFDTNDAHPDGLRHWLQMAPREGITGLLPTTITQSEAVLTAALENVAAVARQGCDGAEILGVHLEGPYLCQAYKGAQPPEHIVPPSVEQFQRLQAAAGGLIRLITLAPEEDEDFCLTRYCAQNGVAVSMGHTNATYAQAMEAVANGVTGATHTFNAMSPLNHRNPGVVGATLRCSLVYGELIPDGIHCHFAAAGIFFGAKGPDRGIVVTDSLLVKGGSEKSYFFGGHEVVLREGGGAAVLAENPATLAGSVLQFNQGLRNLVEKALVPFDAALNACTLNPATHLGLAHRKGRLAAGCDADLVVLADDYSVAQTFCRGRAAL